MAAGKSLGIWRPIGARIVAIVVALVLLVVATTTWFAIGPDSRATFSVFQRGTVIAMGLGMIACLWAIARSKVEAWPDRVVVVNGFKRREFAWAQIVAVRMPQGAPWATLDLADGTTVSALGIQGSDGASARKAVLSLRALLDENS